MVWNISKGVLSTQRKRTKVTALVAAFLLTISSLASAVVPFVQQAQADSPPTSSVTVCAISGCDYTSLQDAVDNVASGGTISVNSDLALTTEVLINKPVTINGNHNTLSGTFTKSGGVNSYLEVDSATGITINYLTIDGTNGTNLHGINTFKTGLALNNVTLENNDYDGLVVNGSDVTVNNITTANNGWGGIDVDQSSTTSHEATLTVNGTSHHTETNADIKIDDTSKAVTVNDANNQYNYTNVGNARLFGLRPVAPADPVNLGFTQGSKNLACDGTTNSNDKLMIQWQNPSANYGNTVTVYGPSGHRLSLSGNNKKSPYTVYGFATDGNGVYRVTVRANTTNSGPYSGTVTCKIAYDTHSPAASFTTTPPTYINSNFQAKGIASDNVKLKNVIFDVRDPNDTTGNSYRAGCVSGTLEENYSNDQQKDAAPTCTINTANLINGQTYTLRIHASDYAGYGGGQQQNFIFDNTAPTGIATYKGGEKTGDTIYLRSIDELKYSANLSDTNELDQTSFVVFKLDSNGHHIANTFCGNWHNSSSTETLSGTSDSVSNVLVNKCSWYHGIGSWTDDTYEIGHIAYDKAGNTFQFNAPRQKLVIDSTKPVVSSFQIDNPAPYTNQIKASAAVTETNLKSVTFYVTEAEDTYPGGAPKCTGNGPYVVPAPGILNGGRYEATLNTSSLTGNKYCVNVVAEDLATNHSVPAGRELVTIDNTAPKNSTSTTIGGFGAAGITVPQNPAPTIFNNLATVFGVGLNAGGTAGNAGAGTVGTPGVLGAKTDKNADKHFGSSNGKVLGDNTDKDKTCSKFLGICWYYWVPIVVVIAGVIYYFFRRRNAQDS